MDKMETKVFKINKIMDLLYHILIHFKLFKSGISNKYNMESEAQKQNIFKILIILTNYNKKN